MSAAERSRSTKVLFRIVSWVGGAFAVLGTIGTLWSLTVFVRSRAGWSGEVVSCCSDLDKASLGGMLTSMFFVLVGSAVILLLHPIRAHMARASGRRIPPWLRWMAAALTVYALGVFSLATVLAGMAEELEGFATGIVMYCMLVGVGMLTAAWGFKRASEL